MNHLEGIYTDNWHFNVFFSLLILAVASIPFSTALLLPIAIVMGVNWIIEWNWKAKWQNFKENKALVATIFFAAIYLIVILGFIQSANKPKAWEDFECKLWFFIAPLMLFTASPKLLNRERISKLLFVFVTSTFINICVLICIAAFRVVMTGLTYYFYYVHLSIFGHPSYVSMYTSLSFYLTLYFLFKNKKNLSLEYRLALYVVMGILMIGVLILRSKAGILAFGVMFIIWVVYLLNNNKRRIGWSTAFLAGCIALCVIGMTTDLLPMNRFKESMTEFQERKQMPYGTGSSQVRLTVWKSAWEVTRDNLPWGVGTGDAMDELCVHAVKKNYTNLIGHHYNCHDQYLQSMLTTGIPGLITVLMFCFYPVVVSIRKKDIVYLTFAIIIILNMLVESMFEVRAGVDFIALMNIILFLRCRLKNEEKEGLGIRD